GSTCITRQKLWTSSPTLTVSTTEHAISATTSAGSDSLRRSPVSGPRDRNADDKCKREKHIAVSHPKKTVVALAIRTVTAKAGVFRWTSSTRGRGKFGSCAT